jgi:hypothetical protein
MASFFEFAATVPPGRKPRASPVCLFNRQARLSFSSERNWADASRSGPHRGGV